MLFVHAGQDFDYRMRVKCSSIRINDILNQLLRPTCIGEINTKTRRIQKEMFCLLVIYYFILLVNEVGLVSFIRKEFNMIQSNF